MTASSSLAGLKADVACVLTVPKSLDELGRTEWRVIEHFGKIWVLILPLQLIKPFLCYGLTLTPVP